MESELIIWLKQMFPQAGLYQYVLEVLSLYLVGGKTRDTSESKVLSLTNKTGDEIVHMFMGFGHNGKKSLMKLIELVSGENVVWIKNNESPVSADHKILLYEGKTLTLDAIERLQQGTNAHILIKSNTIPIFEPYHGYITKIRIIPCMSRWLITPLGENNYQRDPTFINGVGRFVDEFRTLLQETAKNMSADIIEPQVVRQYTEELIRVNIHHQSKLVMDFPTFALF